MVPLGVSVSTLKGGYTRIYAEDIKNELGLWKECEEIAVLQAY